LGVDLLRPLAGRSVLLVGDDPTNLRILSLQLSRLGMRCATAIDAESAVALVRGGLTYDVAIFDLDMPLRGGVALRAKLLAVPGPSAGAPKVLVTSLGQRPDDADHVFDAVLTRPVKSTNLRDALLSLVPQDQTAPLADAPPTSEPGARSRPQRILLAEDNLVNQRVAQLMLKGLGHSVDVVADGAAAVRAVEAQHYDIVLMDVQMPLMDGLEATRRIRDQLPVDRQPFIIAMTASALIEDREACEAAGMEDFLTKPVRKRDLEAMIDRRAVASPPVPTAG
jgi:CheY-like chemotaxis protein